MKEKNESGLRRVHSSLADQFENKAPQNDSKILDEIADCNNAIMLEDMRAKDEEAEALQLASNIRIRGFKI